MAGNQAENRAGMRGSRRGLLRTTAGVVAAGIVGGAVLHNQAEEAQAVERDLAQAGIQGDAFQVSVEGSQQGTFNRITGLGFYYQVGVPVDANTGQVSGQPRHGRVIITKLWDVATPQLFQALVSGEILNQVDLRFNRGGKDYQRVLLINARVADLEQYMHFNAAGHSIGDDPRQLEDVAFSFNEIVIEKLEGKTQAGDVVV